MGEDLTRLQEILHRLQEQIAWGLVSLEIWESLNSAREEHRLNQAPWFLGSTLWSHSDLAILTLARLTDKNKSSGSIYYLLNKVELMVGQRKLEIDNPDRIMDWTAEDRIRLNDEEKSIQTIRGCRDKAIAHIDRSYVADPLQAYKDFGLDMIVMNTLFHTLKDIVTRYASLLPDQVWDLNIPRDSVKGEIKLILQLVNNLESQTN